MDKEEKQYNIRFLTVQIKKKADFLIEQSSKSSKFPKSPKSCQHQNVKYLPLKEWGEWAGQSHTILKDLQQIYKIS